jgi:hypothetical protein
VDYKSDKMRDCTYTEDAGPEDLTFKALVTPGRQRDASKSKRIRSKRFELNKTKGS